ncbi:MAG: enoyl-CoA hydratase/isomerase family protein [Verrucomicrobia bacterium]|nr:enoyl-CoA hydratase/isomerase family protein [Verrucomicrobiota bacterium]MCH8512682.1 enoyl-CoA hydratase/isomerase family protein [Kiritimatiellia bacterium]
MNIQQTQSDDKILLVTFDRAKSSANIFDEQTLTELEKLLDEIASLPDIKGLIFLSAKPAIFIAGADLNLLGKELPDAELDAYIARGQALMQKVADLPFPTVAAIHGACLGGGYELALACDYRVATPDRATKIGLPETQIGILPAWGGSSRLPRLIGLPKALDIILGGKTPPAKLARKLGMVDDLAPRESLEKCARQLIENGRPKPRPQYRLLHTPPAVALIRHIARKNLQKKTRGNYPAVWKALEVVTEGLSKSMEDSLRLERKALPGLARSPECSNLLGVYFLTERAKHLEGEAGAEVAEVRRAAVIGAGAMGAGIAQWLTSRGLPVLLRDISPEALAKGMSTVNKLYVDAVRHHVLDAREAREGRDLLSPSAKEVPLKSVDLIVEAALEDLELKKELFADLESRADAHTLLATNTSALSLAEIGEDLQRPERLVGIHFFNPVHRMKLVEVISGPQTSAEAVATALRFVQKIGKMPVRVKDSPGFLVNRILMPYLVEAALLFEERHGIAEIDEAMLEFGMPMGPLRLIDEVGHDIALHVAQNLCGHFQDHMVNSALLEKTVEKGWLGKKSGQGFYNYDKKREAPNPELASLLSGTSTAGGSASSETLARRMVLPMCNEAARCLQEEVAGEPEDVDFAMIMGTGFAPFRGGPLRHADAVGLSTLVAQLEAEVDAGRKRFAPCERLKKMAENKTTFYPPTPSRKEDAK